MNLHLPQLITLLIFGGFGAVMLYVGSTQWWLQRRLMRHAVPVTARITHSAVFRRPARDDDEIGTERPEVRFRYQVQGRSYESDMLHPTIILQGESCDEVLAAYPLGTSVVAWVDPAHPDKGFLRSQAGAGPGVFVALGVLLPPLAWWIGGML